MYTAPFQELQRRRRRERVYI